MPEELARFRLSGIHARADNGAQDRLQIAPSDPDEPTSDPHSPELAVSDESAHESVGDLQFCGNLRDGDELRSLGFSR
ncbi:hypothetical protein ASD18_19350 [Cellulomonas sp. Root137]|nr:hypothetical protein ASD18_19350 [Cellulomonas sp. Root137]